MSLPDKYKTESFKNKLLESSNGACALCGKQFDGLLYNKDWVISKVIPTSIVKFSNIYKPNKHNEDVYNEVLYSYGNLIPVHKDCTIRKGGYILPMNNMVRELFISEEHKTETIINYSILQPVIEDYNELIDYLMHKQEHKCFTCDRCLTDYYSLRYIINKRINNVDNVCLVCTNCSKVNSSGTIK